MSTKEAVVLASRTLATLLVVWALTDVTYLPVEAYEFLHHSSDSPVVTSSAQYWHHYYFMVLGFNLIRIVGFLLVARWLYAGGPEVAQLFLPMTEGERS